MDDIYLKDVIVRGVDIPLKKPIVSHLGNLKPGLIYALTLLQTAILLGKVI